MSDTRPTESPKKFDAWIESNKLHVHGEIHVADASLFYQLEKKDPQGYFHEELLLDIKPDITPGSTKVEVKFHEDLQSDSEYTRVIIMANNEEFARIAEVRKK